MGAVVRPGHEESNRRCEIPLPKAIPIMSFGEDQDGELYFTTYSPEGQGVYRLLPAAPAVSQK